MKSGIITFAAILGIVGAAMLFVSGCKSETTQSQTAVQAGVVNTKCPIMGNKIDPNNVPANLVREYKGQKVGFCCGGCPGAWDKLSDAEKDAKLTASK